MLAGLPRPQGELDGRDVPCGWEALASVNGTSPPRLPEPLIWPNPPISQSGSLRWRGPGPGAGLRQAPDAQHLGPPPHPPHTPAGPHLSQGRGWVQLPQALLVTWHHCGSPGVFFAPRPQG